jgi:ribosome-associated heat shock protein Hsp15
VKRSEKPEAHPERATDTLESVRLDTWLDVSCLFRTRSEAQKACKSGKVEVNGQPAKPHRLVRSEDQIEISRPFGRKQRICVKVVVDAHLPRAEARKLYADLTPPPTQEEIEHRRLERIYRAAMTPARPPDRRERRTLRRLKNKE